MADEEKKNGPAATTAQKATTAVKAARTDEPVSGDFPQEDQEVTKDGEFDGKTRYEGTILVDRQVGDDIVSVLTDRPRPGDKVQALTLNRETGELERSTESAEKSGAARMPGKS